MKVLYFSWLRDRTGVGEEQLSPPESVTTVRLLIEWLVEQGGGHQAAFADLEIIRVAVNQEYVNLDTPLSAGDEVAFFPPVTGG